MTQCYCLCYTHPRVNATGAQVPLANHQLYDEDRATEAKPNSGFRNTWYSPVVGTLPPEWGNLFPNMEVM